MIRKRCKRISLSLLQQKCGIQWKWCERNSCWWKTKKKMKIYSFNAYHHHHHIDVHVQGDVMCCNVMFPTKTPSTAQCTTSATNLSPMLFATAMRFGDAAYANAMPMICLWRLHCIASHWLTDWLTVWRPDGDYTEHNAAHRVHHRTWWLNKEREKDLFLLLWWSKQKIHVLSVMNNFFLNAFIMKLSFHEYFNFYLFCIK